MYDIKEKPDYFLIDYRANRKIKNNLEKLNYNYVETKENNNLYPEIKGHPDIVACPLNNKYTVVDKTLYNDLEKQNFKIIKGKSDLKSSYPLDISYNFTTLSNHIIGNIKNIDSQLKTEITKLKLQSINVKQGYSKCNILVLKENTIITGDISIYKTLKDNPAIKTYYINDQGIYLSDRYKGFIGGAGGLLEPGLIGFFGTIEKMSFAKEIKEILKKEKIEYENLSDSVLCDYGSLVPIFKNKL